MPQGIRYSHAKVESGHERTTNNAHRTDHFVVKIMGWDLFRFWTDEPNLVVDSPRFSGDTARAPRASPTQFFVFIFELAGFFLLVVAHALAEPVTAIRIIKWFGLSRCRSCLCPFIHSFPNFQKLCAGPYVVRLRTQVSRPQHTGYPPVQGTTYKFGHLIIAFGS